MASSNRHWPSMFKSKPCNSSHHHQWQQHDMNSSLVSSNGCQRSPYSSGCEERSPEPKPRWNPRPEQIRILEAIFNSGMVNPPREEIRKIRAQLQEYGQVGDANVFYWFQNRKSRSKHKQRHLQNSKLQSQSHTHDPIPPSPVTSIALPTAPSSSSSSSDRSYSPNSADKVLSLGSKNMLLDASSSSPTASVNQPFLQSHSDFLSMAPFFFPVQQEAAATGGGGGGTSNNNNTTYTQGFLTFPPPPNIVSSVADNSVESCSGLLLSDLLVMNHGSSRRAAEDHEKMKLQQLLSYSSTTAPSPLSPTSITSIPTLNATTIQGVGETGGVGPTKSTVFINDVAFEVTMMAPFNVREAFGDDAVLIHSSGQPVLTNEWGLTLQPLQHGSSYYLIRTLAAPDAPTSTTHHHHHYLDDTTIHINWYFNHHPLRLPLILISFDFVTLIDDRLDFLFHVFIHTFTLTELSSV